MRSIVAIPTIKPKSEIGRFPRKTLLLENIPNVFGFFYTQAQFLVPVEAKALGSDDRVTEAHIHEDSACEASQKYMHGLHTSLSL